MSQGLRDQILQKIASGDAHGAIATVREFWKSNPGPSSAGVVLKSLEQLREQWNPAACRVAILRSFTVEPLVPLLRASAAVAGIDASVWVGDFNTYVQEILDSGSGLYQFAPDVVILAVQTADIAPALWRDFTALPPEQAQAAIEATVGSFRNCIEQFRARSAAHLIVHNLDVPACPAAGLLDAQTTGGQAEAIRAINRKLVEIAAAHSGVYVLDYEALVARHGQTAWYDAQRWATMRLPIAGRLLPSMAEEWIRFLCPLTGKIAKALVVDLDNTLWGGVIGEDGMAGIRIGQEYPGSVFLELQRTILDLYHRGVILAICSKNNEADAMEVFERHPGMLLKTRHFGASRINWSDKAHNLRELAVELNIGLDAVAFLDDNPAEREWIRKQLPEVTVIDLPVEPGGYAQALRSCPVFERLKLAVEDRERGRFYAEQGMRESLKQRTGSVEDFYRSLEMRAEIAPVTPQTLARIAQLTQKTNQFNLTTRRYSEQQVSEMAARPGWHVLSMSVVDIFGDNGIVGVAIIHTARGVCEIDTMLLSCRVIGRTVETAFLAAIAEQAARDGARELTGWFLPTKKNAPAKDFYKAHGFTCAEDQKDGASRWSFDLTAGSIHTPEWIDRRVAVGAAQ